MPSGLTKLQYKASDFWYKHQSPDAYTIFVLSVNIWHTHICVVDSSTLSLISILQLNHWQEYQRGRTRVKKGTQILNFLSHLHKTHLTW